MTFKETWKKIWHFLWKSNSPWSFLVDIILIFLIVKFLLLPGIGLMLGTSVPLVIVESGSMEHSSAQYCLSYNQNKCAVWSTDYRICDKSFGKTSSFDFNRYWIECGSWYESRNISQGQFSKFSFKNGFNKGDIMIIQGKKDYQVGDIIVFKVSGSSTPIIHRIVAVHNDGTYETKGDHNDGQLSPPYSPVDEKNILKQQILGKAVFDIPKLGWIKLFFVDLFS